MKNKVLKVLLATMLMVSMFSTTCMAAAGELTESDLAGGQEVTGTATIKNPIYSIVVPTGFEFAVDAFEQGGQSQVYSQEFNIINKSNVNVRVNVNAKAEALLEDDAAAIIKDTEAEVTETDTSKLIYLAIQVPSVVAEATTANQSYATPLYTSTASSTVPYSTEATSEGEAELKDVTAISGVTGTYTTSAKEGLSTTAKDYLFALKKADYTDYKAAESNADTLIAGSQFKNVAASTAGSTTFRFWGKVNSKAAWQTGEVKVTAKYTFLGLSDTNYDALIAKQVTNSHAFVKEDTAPTFTSPVDELCVINYTKGEGSVALNKIIKMTAPFNGEDAFDFTAYLTDTNGKITMPDTYPAAFADENNDGTVTFTITYDKVGGGDDDSENNAEDDVTVTVDVTCAIGD